MRLLLLFTLCIYCINQGNGYVFPLCFTNEKSCKNYFKLPSISLPQLPDLSLTVDDNEEEISDVLDSRKQVSLPNTLRNILISASLCYRENVRPVLSQFFTAVVTYMPVLKEQCWRLWGYMPFLKEEKVKADSRLYFLFILTSISIYLGLYIYFTRKLYYYYQGNLRLQYLNNVKKIFKAKE